MKAIYKYIEMHHREYGVALVVIPVVLFAGAMLGAAYVLAWVLR
jgi:hypothetical protein